MLANALTDYLKTVDGLVPSGYIVRTGKVEADASRAIMVMLPLGGFNQTLDTGRLYRGNQQILVRSPDPMECYDLCEAITEAVTVIGSPLSLDGYQVKMMKPRGLPVVYPINDAGLWEGSVNYDTSAVRT